MLSNTVLLISIPAVTAILVLLLKGPLSKWLALIGASINALVYGVTLQSFDPSAGIQFETNVPWIQSLGAQFHVGIDGISAVMLMLSIFLVPIIILSAFEGRAYSNRSVFYALILMMQSALIGVFTSLDCFLFYIFWELALIPIYFLSAIWGEENRLKITFKFFLYTIFGSLLMLAGIIYLYLQTGDSGSFDHTVFSSIQLTCWEEPWVFAAFMLAFAIKMPIFPFHTWQPDTYTQSPTPATMLLSGIMLKMGLFGVLRWVMPVMPGSFMCYSMPIMLLAVIGIVYASILAIRQDDMKKLVAYASIAHVGLIVSGILTANTEGLQGSILQMLNHGINAVALFYVLEIIAQRTQTRSIQAMGGIVHKAPVLSIFFVIIMLGTVALPLTNGFVGEFLLLFSIYQVNTGLAVAAGTTIILGAVYMLRMYKSIMLGEANHVTENFKDVQPREFLILSILSLAIIVLGIYPNIILDVSSDSVENLLHLTSSSCHSALILK